MRCFDIDHITLILAPVYFVLMIGVFHVALWPNNHTVEWWGVRRGDDRTASC